MEWYLRRRGRLGRYIWLRFRDRLHGENVNLLEVGRGEVGSTELVTYIPFVFNHPLTSERRTVETVLEKDWRIQLVL